MKFNLTELLKNIIRPQLHNESYIKRQYTINDMTDLLMSMNASSIALNDSVISADFPFNANRSGILKIGNYEIKVYLAYVKYENVYRGFDIDSEYMSKRTFTLVEI